MNNLLNNNEIIVGVDPRRVRVLCLGQVVTRDMCLGQVVTRKLTRIKEYLLVEGDPILYS